MRSPSSSIGIGCLLALLAGQTLGMEAAPANPPAPANPQNAAPSYPSDEDRLDGDHLKLRVNVDGFKPIDGPDKDKVKCAPKGSKIVVTRQKGNDLLVRFKLEKAAKSVQPTDKPLKADDNEKPGFFATEEAASSAAIRACGEGIVNDYTQYSIDAATLADHSYRRTGVMFGALIVPFKFHLGSSKKLSSSSTVAPYIGFRGPAPFGLTFTPVVSAGLGLVPISDPATSETSTRTAFSAALGVLLTHSKNDKFNAGILLGKDFLSKADRAADESADNIWFSLYAGYKL